MFQLGTDFVIPGLDGNFGGRCRMEGSSENMVVRSIVAKAEWISRCGIRFTKKVAFRTGLSTGLQACFAELARIRFLKVYRK